MLFNRFLSVKNYFNTKKPDVFSLAIVDDSVPNKKQLGFRSYEFNCILEQVPCANIWTMSKTFPGKDAFFHHSYGQKYAEWKNNKKLYLSKYSKNKDRLYWLDTKKSYSFDLAYVVFLCTTYTLLPFLENNKIPFVFVLYPGGGFGLNNSSSDKMLKKVCQSEYCKSLICTQPITYQYLIEKNFIAKEKIFFLFGGYLQFQHNYIKQKLYYKKDKNTLDVCFVGFKYSEHGVDKGFDLFIEVAKELLSLYPFLRFHVVGNFDKTDVQIRGVKNKILFHGVLTPYELEKFYTKMDVCLSPNRPFKLYRGNFDGFPLCFDAMAFGTVLMTTDELNNNQGFFVDGYDLVIIRPYLYDILKKIIPLIEDTKKLYSIGKRGNEKIFKIMHPKNRVNSVVRILKKIIKDEHMKPKVSIICITYNHEKFIRQALDGFVMQKTNFPFEVIIHDDASTDRTADIIREYAKKYPKIIKPIFQKENQWRKGKLPIIHFMLDKIQGKYVAMCEGDDYWTDENKLQKQVDFLDKNPEFSLCFHPVKVVWEDNSFPDDIFPKKDYIFNKDVLSLSDLLKHNFIQTNSVLYRWNLTKKDWPTKEFLPADYLFHLIHAKQGKIKYLDDVMAVYRKHSGGVWDGCGKTDEWFLRCGLLHTRFFDIIEKKFNVEKQEEKQWMLSRTLDVLSKHKKYEEIEYIRKEFADIVSIYKNKHRKQRIKKFVIICALCSMFFIFCCVIYVLIKG